MSLPVREAPTRRRETAPAEDSITVHLGRVLFILERLRARIGFLERAITLLIVALFLMTACNVMIILRVFF